MDVTTAYPVTRCSGAYQLDECRWVFVELIKSRLDGTWEFLNSAGDQFRTFVFVDLILIPFEEVSKGVDLATMPTPKMNPRSCILQEFINDTARLSICIEYTEPLQLFVDVSVHNCYILPARGNFDLQIWVGRCQFDHKTPTNPLSAPLWGRPGTPSRYLVSNPCAAYSSDRCWPNGYYHPDLDVSLHPNWSSTLSACIWRGWQSQMVLERAHQRRLSTAVSRELERYRMQARLGRRRSRNWLSKFHHHSQASRWS